MNSPGKHVFGLRRSALTEIAVYLTALLALDWWGFSGDRFWTVSPHPFWPIVLLLAIQYGTSEALLAAGCATAALLAGNIPPQSIDQDVYTYLFAIVKNPFLWTLAALVLGEIRMRHVRERRELEDSAARLEARGKELAAAYERLKVIKENLESRIATQLRTAVTMYQATRTLERQDPSEVLLGVVDTVRSIMNPIKCSLYLLREDTLEISVGHGWEPGDSHIRVFRPTSTLFREVIGNQRVLCAVNRDDEMILSTEGVLAGPLVDTETGSVLGMLKIEKLGFLDLHFSNIQTFKILCEWIADSYLNAQRFETASGDNVYQPGTQVLTYSFFERQKEFLKRLAVGVGFDVSLIVVRIDNLDEVGTRKAATIPTILREISAGVLRGADQLFEYQPGGTQFCIVLPGTSVKNAEIVAGKLEEVLKGEIAERIAPVKLSLTIRELFRPVSVEEVPS